MITVTATSAARAMIDALKAEHGPLTIHVSGSYGATAICLKERELNIGALDVPIGTIDDVAIYMMTSEIKNWRGNTLVLDVAHGVGVGFSLEGSKGQHFTLRKRADPGKRSWDADAILAAGPPPIIHPRER